MAEPFTITNLDTAATAWIEQEAQRTGTSVEDVVRRLIYRGLAVERQQPPRYHGLDSLAGTWSAEEADEFCQAIAGLNEIDPTIWQ